MSVDRDLLWLRGQFGEDMPWHEAELMAAPCKPRDLKGPRVLVRRRVGELVGSRGEDLVVLPGHPAISEGELTEILHDGERFTGFRHPPEAEQGMSEGERP